MAALVPRPPIGRVFEGARRVRLADVSPAGRLRLDAAARFLQDLSADDTADAALEDAEAWVVRKTVIEVTAFPRYLEPLELATWCSGTGSHWAERRISIRGERGGGIEAATTWVHIDLTSGRPSRIPAGFDDLYGEAHGGRRVKARLDHPDPPDGRARRLRLAPPVHGLRRPRPRQQRGLLADRRAGAGRATGPASPPHAPRSSTAPPSNESDRRGAQHERRNGLASWAMADGAIAMTAVVERS